MSKWEFIGRRWFEFRYGHTLYLVFIMSFTNFILIFYNLGLGESTDMSVVTFSIMFVIFYVPVAVTVGYFHRRRQLRIDMVQQWNQNPMFMQLLKDVEEIKETLSELRESS